MTLMLPNPVIKEITLPVNVMFFGQIMFPCSHDCFHRLAWGKADQRMNVIRHKQEDEDKPAALRLIVFGRSEDSIGGRRVAELIDVPK